MTPADCRFCSVGEQKVLDSRALVRVLFSHPRLMPGHLLVIPRRHVTSLVELNVDERKELFDTAIEYQRKIIERLASGCDITQHDRPFLPENDLKVDHVHLHIKPREFEDELYLKASIHDREIFKALTDEEVQEITEKLK